jgi:hypothetical protein
MTSRLLVVQGWPPGHGIAPCMQMKWSSGLIVSRSRRWNRPVAVVEGWFASRGSKESRTLRGGQP